MRIEIPSRLNLVEGVVKGFNIHGKIIYFEDSFYEIIKECKVIIEFYNSVYLPGTGFTANFCSVPLNSYDFSILNYNDLSYDDAVTLNTWLDADHVMLNGNYKLYLEHSDDDILSMIKLSL